MDLNTMSLPTIWDKIAEETKAHPEYTEGISASYSVILTGAEEAEYGLIFEEGTTRVIDGKVEKPDCTLTMNVKYFKKLLQGDLNTTAAFMTGKLKVKGNIGLALKLENTLKKFSF